VERLAEDPRVERTRDVVRRHVRDLIRTEGIDAVTPLRVSSDTGVSRSTLHRHWPDIRSLLIEAVHDPDPVLETPLLGDLRLDLGVDLHNLRLQLSDRETLGLIVSMLGRSAFDEGFGAVVREHTRAHLDRLGRVLAAGQAEGRLSTDIDLDVAAATLAGPLFFRRVVQGEELTPEFVEAVIDRFIAANTPHQRTTP
jgi:AcrR family transcriptional regulator